MRLVAALLATPERRASAEVPTPPAAPQNLVAAPLDGAVRLTWSAVAGATEYNVYRGGVVVMSVTVPTATVTGLVNGTAYTFRVTALSAVGEGAQSSAVAATGAALGGGSSFALCRPPGHHAGRDYLGGYSYLSNAAIAAEEARVARLGRCGQARRRKSGSAPSDRASG